MKNGIHLVIFDMDGTITRPYIDFARIRQALRARPDQTILEYINTLEGQVKLEASATLEQFEAEAAANSELNEGAREVVAQLDQEGYFLGLVTNNSRRSAETVLTKHGLSHFDLVLTRDDGEPKPSDALLQLTLQQAGVRPHQVVFVGDGKYDLMAGQRAGIRTIRVRNGDPTAMIVPGQVDQYEEIETLWHLPLLLNGRSI